MACLVDNFYLFAPTSLIFSALLGGLQKKNRHSSGLAFQGDCKADWTGPHHANVVSFVVRTLA
jgi:hypothetical protein